jgi:FkbM family methyltransferase
LDFLNGAAWPERPIAFVVVSSNHGTFIVNRHDYRMIDETKGFGVAFQILNSSCYDYPETKFLLALLSNRREFYGDGVVAIDCGANCGVHTVEWSRHMFGWGDVIAIEAQEKLYYALCGNIAINNCLNAKAILAAVGGEAKEILVPRPDYLKPASFGSLEIRKGLSGEFIGQQVNYEKDCVKLPQVTIDGLDLDRVDLLKVDVEGMEAEVLAGAEETITRHMPQMYIEVLKSDVEVIKRILKTLGYRHFDFGPNLFAVHEKDRAGANISMREGMLHVSVREESLCPTT